MTKIVIALALASIAAPTWAAECGSYNGRVVAPVPIATAFSRYAGVKPRGEFESTAEFEARVARQTGGSGEMIVGKPIEGAQFLAYDADRQVLKVKIYLFDNTNFSTDSIFGYGGPLADFKFSTSFIDAIDVGFPDVERVTGSYRGTNAFGVSATIYKVAVTRYGIFDEPAAYRKNNLIEPVGEDQVIAELPMPPADAQRLKATARIAFVVVPKAPWAATGERGSGTPTLQSPREITTTTHVLFADIQCALLMDGTNKVVAAFATR